MMIYTSGTTGRPKGVVHTHGSIAAMVDGMLAAWAWSADDRIVLVLPLNHVHGIVNVTLCPLAVGACCEAPGGFDAADVWERLASGEVTVFMAVPTIYARLVVGVGAGRRGRPADAWSAGAAGLRLMVCGSAALPVSTLDRWRELTGHVLLERYGMTELGMVLSNTLDAPGARPRRRADARRRGARRRRRRSRRRRRRARRAARARTAGVRRVLASARRRRPTRSSTGGSAPATSPCTSRTGTGCSGGRRSTSSRPAARRCRRWRSRRCYRTHPDIADCAVVGIPDDEWGERVCAAVVAGGRRRRSTPATLRAWGKEQLAPAKVPSRFAFVDELPRNTLGKVLKPEVTRLF